MEKKLKLTEVQKSILVAALATNGTTTVTELRDAVPEVDRRVEHAVEVQEARFLHGGCTTPVWKIFYQLRAKGLLEMTKESRGDHAARVWALTDKGATIAATMVQGAMTASDSDAKHACRNCGSLKGEACPGCSTADAPVYICENCQLEHIC